MAFYNLHATMQIITDASLDGLGAILTQKQENGDYKPVVYGLRSLTDTDSRYNQTEKEALPVMWSCD